MYTHRNFKTKKALKDAVATGQQLTYFQPDPLGVNDPKEGVIFIEGPHNYGQGPHYHGTHKWYAHAEVKDGVIVKVW